MRHGSRFWISRLVNGCASRRYCWLASGAFDASLNADRLQHQSSARINCIVPRYVLTLGNRQERTTHVSNVQHDLHNPPTLHPRHHRPRREGSGRAIPSLCRCPASYDTRPVMVERTQMVRRTIMTVALVGFLMLGVGAQRVLGQPPLQCFVCYCTGVNGLTACAVTPIDVSQCPTCPTGSPETDASQDPCNKIAACRPFLSRAPALSPIPLAGLGLLLVGTGVWMTKRRRTRAAV